MLISFTNVYCAADYLASTVFLSIKFNKISLYYEDYDSIEFYFSSMQLFL